MLYIILFFSRLLFSDIIEEEQPFDEIPADCDCGNGVQDFIPKNKLINPCPKFIYGASIEGENGESFLYYLDPHKGTGVPIGLIVGLKYVTAMDFSPDGHIYAVGQNEHEEQVLARISCRTAIATIIGKTNAPTQITSINFDSKGALFGHMDPIPQELITSDHLIKLNISTGAYTMIGDTMMNDFGSAIGFADFPNNTLYHADHEHLSVLNQETGMSTNLYLLTFFDPVINYSVINDMDYDPINKKMYVSISDKPSDENAPDFNYLGILSLSNGDVNFVKTPPNLAPKSLSAIAINRAYETCDGNTNLPEGTICTDDCKLKEIDCSDLVDNDNDGKIDCADSDCEDKPCSGLESCLAQGICQNGECVDGIPKICNDFNICTDDICLEGDCLYIPNNVSCDDNNICTYNDQCSEGECTGIKIEHEDQCGTNNCCIDGLDNDCDGLVDQLDPDCPGPGDIETNCHDYIDNDGDGDTDCEDIDCQGEPCYSDANDCTNDVCNNYECQHLNNMNMCDDGNICTSNDICIGGICTGTNNNNNCDDLDYCTTNDHCVLGTCVGSLINCNDDNDCTLDSCNLGDCLHINLPNGTACNDDYSCSIDDQCIDGVCIGQPGVENCCNGLDDDCDLLIDSADPDCFHSTILKAFVTSTSYKGNFGGSNFSDDECQSLADAAGLGGTFKSIVSDNLSNAFDRILNTYNKPWYLVTGVPNLVANNKADLFDGTILQAVNVDENGNFINNSKFCWTGSDINGQVNSSNCNNWTSSAPNLKGIWGATDKINYQWINQPEATCGQERHFYCFEIDETQGCNNDLDCTSESECKIGTCDTESCYPGCSYTNVENGTSCNENSGTCQEGVCVPNDICSAGLKVFVTDAVYTATQVVSSSNADSICQQIAIAQSIPGNFVAFVSDSITNAQSKLTDITSPWILLDEACTLVALNSIDLLDGSIQNPINVTETGSTVPNNNKNVWTGSNYDGTLLDNCVDWSSNLGSDSGYNGATDKATTQWSTQTAGSCSNTGHIYCFEVPGFKK